MVKTIKILKINVIEDVTRNITMQAKLKLLLDEHDDELGQCATPFK